MTLESQYKLFVEQNPEKAHWTYQEWLEWHSNKLGESIEKLKKMEQHFDISRIIGIELTGIRETHHRWLPRKQKTFFFGLFKRNSWHSEGYYDHGCYEEGYGGDFWDAREYTAEELRGRGYIVDESTSTVYHKAHVTVFLEGECKVSSSFDSETEASSWVSDLRKRSGKEFEIIRK